MELREYVSPENQAVIDAAHNALMPAPPEHVDASELPRLRSQARELYEQKLNLQYQISEITKELTSIRNRILAIEKQTTPITVLPPSGKNKPKAVKADTIKTTEETAKMIIEMLLKTGAISPSDLEVG